MGKKQIGSWYLEKVAKNGHHLSKKRQTASLAGDLLMDITRPFFIRFWLSFIENACFFETNRMVTNSKRYLLCFRFRFLAPFLLQGLTWATMQHCARGPKTTFKRLGCVLAYPFNSYLKIKVSKITGLNPPPLVIWLTFVMIIICSIIPAKAEDVVATLETVHNDTVYTQCLTILGYTLLLYLKDRQLIPQKIKAVAKKLLDVNINAISGQCQFYTWKI